MMHIDKILNAVNECEGLTAGELGVLLETSREEVNRGLILLMREGKVRRERREREYIYFKGDGTPSEPEPRKSWKVKAKPTDAGLQVQLAEAKAAIAELEEWKRRAIERYPDLAVSDIVLRARKIVARTSPEHAKEVLAGRCDDKPIMLATVAALEETL